MSKSKKIRFATIEKVSGMYQFPARAQETDASFLDFSKCNCMDDMVSLVLDEEVEELELRCKKEVLVLVKEFTQELLQLDEGISIVWVVETLCEPYVCELSLGEVMVTPNRDTRNAEKRISFLELKRLLGEEEEVETPDYVEIIKNAFSLMVTGKYPNSYIYSKANHVYVTEKETLNEMDLYKFMDINSVIFLPRSEYDEETYRNWKERYYNNIHFVDQENIYLDNNQQIGWTIKDYAKLDAVNEDCTEPCYLNLEEKEDWELLLSDLTYFSETGKIRNYRFYLVNECRWANRCSLLYQMRFTLFSDQTLSICGGKERQAYSLEDDEYEQFSEREKTMEQAQRKHNCRNCSVSGWCTKCAYPPEQDGENMFCKIMKEHTEIQDFINVKNAILILERYGRKNSKFRLNEMAFANYKHTLLLPPSMEGKKPIAHNAYLFEYQGAYYCFNPIRGKILQIGFYLAFILEAIQKGYSYDETETAFHEKWSDTYQAEEFKVAWDKVNGSILH